MPHDSIALSNTVFWGADDKQYLESVRLSVGDLTFATRQVVLRFAGGPSIDLCFYDMDRLAIHYLGLRGVTLSADLQALVKTAPAPQGDFVVPKELVAGLKNTKPRKGTRVAKRTCERCRMRKPDSGDWYGELCPECADATDGDWHCGRCARTGNFEEMDGTDTEEPRCCGLACEQTSERD